MNDHPIAQQLIGMKNADLQLRDQLLQSGQLFEDYHPDMEALHSRNASALDRMIGSIGYPTAAKVGQEAAAAAWLIIQHAISRPAFMRKCRDLLDKAVRDQSADPVHLAYLTDRIAIFEGRPQRYGTQFDWDAQGDMSPLPCDDESRVNERRKRIGLNTLEEQTAIIRQRVAEEDQQPPDEPARRKQEEEAWKKRVGWI
ncbi:MAG: hypothetical protein INR69_08070 [Mucilaginibacter polytrichastri]|nr:hypothetical protein [Mucilaginibacter polytrichastri]